MCWTQKVDDAGPGAAHGNGEVADNEVASHPLIANLFQEICAENPELPALVLEITTAAKGAVAVPNPTTTPGELREEAPQALRRVCSKSAAARRPRHPRLR